MTCIDCHKIEDTIHGLRNGWHMFDARTSIFDEADIRYRCPECQQALVERLIKERDEERDSMGDGHKGQTWGT